jgi:NAD(P)-dependent dehydrogenase (short-subunit alcohol dehydrogenase family)
MKDFKNKKVLITGGTKGLGLICVKNFLNKKAKVFAVGRDEKYIKKISNKNLKFFKSNLLDQLEKKKFFNDIKKINNIDIIIHCMGGGLGLKENLIKLEDFTKLFYVNLGIASEINLKIFNKLNRKQSYILHIGSTASSEAIGSVGYNSIKAAIVAYVKTLASRLLKKNVFVSSILPGAFIAPGNAFERLKKKNLKIFNNFKDNRLPRKKIAKAEEFLPIINLLCSKDGEMLAGSSITVDACETKSYKF